MLMIVLAPKDIYKATSVEADLEKSIIILDFCKETENFTN